MKVLFQRPYFAGHMFFRSGRLFAGNLRRWAAGEAPRWAVNAPPSLRGPGQAS